MPHKDSAARRAWLATYDRGTVPRICPTCGSHFLARTDLVNIGRGIYCQKSCRRGPHSNTKPFSAYVDTSGECWLWTGGLFTETGYGNYWSRGAHCVAYEKASGQPIPKGMIIGHICDVKRCVRNDGGQGTYAINGALAPRYGHLWLGTHAQNTADMIAKGRSRIQPKKLTPEQENEIRQRRASGHTPYRTLARMYDVSPSTICTIVRSGVDQIEQETAHETAPPQ